MTDKEIIKVLECCSNGEPCSNCPYQNQCDETDLAEIALDLINRLQAENDNLNIELQAMRISANSFKSKYKSAVDTAKTLQSVIKEKDAEIERLTTLAKLGNMRADDYRAMRDKCKTAKAEAIKELQRS